MKRQKEVIYGIVLLPMALSDHENNYFQLLFAFKTCNTFAKTPLSTNKFCIYSYLYNSVLCDLFYIVYYLQCISVQIALDIAFRLSGSFWTVLTDLKSD